MTAAQLRAACTLAMLAALPPSWAAAATLTLAYAPPFTMSATGDHAALALPVTVGATPAATVCVEKLGVQFPNLTDARIVEHFKVRKLLVTDKDSVPTLQIDVDKVSTLLPGVYQLNLRAYECGSGERGKDLDTLVVPITRPSVKLEPQSKVVIDRWLSTPWTDQAYRVSPAHLTFRPQEDARTSPIHALKVEPSYFTTGANSTNVGRWKAIAPVDAAAGDSFDIAFEPSAFPVGIASGQITLRGNDLQAPLRFDVDVRTRLAAWWIVLLVILGVLAGWWLRIVLQRRIDLAAARQPALEKLQRYRGELAGIPDTAFRKDVEGPMNNLLDAVNADDVAAIATAAREASEKVETARVHLNTRLETAATAIDALRDTVDVRAQLPARFTAVRDDALRAANDCAAMLSPPNPSAATSALAEKQRRMLEGLADAQTSLKEQLALVLDQLPSLSPVLADAERRRLAENITAVQSSAGALVAATDLGSAKALLLGAAQLGRDLRALLEWSARAVELDGPILDQLIATRAPDQALDSARGELKGQLLALAAQIRAQAQLEDPFVAPAWSGAAGVALAAGRRLLERLASSRTDMDANAAAAFRHSIADGNWHAALIALLPANPALGEAAAPRDLAEPADLVAASVNPMPGKLATLQAPQVSAFTQPAIAAATRRNKLQLARAEGMQSFAVAVLLGFTSFAFFEDKFIGTWSELLALFFWGFSADLSADKLAEKIRALGVAPK